MSPVSTVMCLFFMLVSMPTAIQTQRTTLAVDGDVLPDRPPGEWVGLSWSGGALGSRSEAPPPRTLVAPPPSPTPGPSSRGEVGVFTSPIVTSRPPVVTSSVVQGGGPLTCLPSQPVSMVTAKLLSVVVMVTTLPELV